ncbi:MAG TPA: TIGR03118 family protein, partial [Verrucomicrobiae bacterium]
MKENTNKWAATIGLRLLAVTLTLACGTIAATAKPTAHIAGYRQINLVSDLPRLAQLVDTNLVNPWGMSFSGTGPFWVSDNGAGLVTLYTVTNRGAAQIVTKEGLEVAIPGEGAPTGQVFDGAGAFNGDVFIFAGEDGTISGWKGSLGSAAELLASRSNAVYKGITLVTNTGSPLLLLANFREGTIDVYDTSFNLVQYADTNVPAGYAPFNVQTVGGFVFVTFAKQDAAQHDDVAGAGNGLIEVFNVTGGTFHRFATGASVGGTLSAINSPWGMTLAPA